MAISPRKPKTTAQRAKSARPRYVVCVTNEGYAASLEKRKIYQLLPDVSATAHHLLRVVDESGDDYLYPADWFMPIAVSPAIAKALTAAA